MRILTARWVFPVASPPIADGAVGIRGGRILAVGRRADVVAAWPDEERWDLGEAALLPGLVNCHAHLEIGPLPGSGRPEAFVPWVIRVIEHRRATPLHRQRATAETNVAFLLRSGTTSVGDVSTTGQSLAPLLRLGLRGVVYREILGLAPDEAGERMRAAQTDIQSMDADARGSRLAIGLSPHSLYALSEDLIAACSDLVRHTGVSPAVHAAESRSEWELLETGSGPIAERLYPAVGCATPPPRRPARSPVAYLAALGALAWRPVLIHAVHVDEADCRLMAAHGVRVAHCPRSNRVLSNGTAPVPRFLSHGIPVGLGTDSLASAPDLDLWEEMRAALTAQAGRVSPAAVLEMATLGGARVLGTEDRVGSLEVGKQADVIAVAASSMPAGDPVAALLDRARGEDVLLVLIDGDVRHRRNEVVLCA